MANGPTQSTLLILEMPPESYYSAVAQYLDNYMMRIEERLPTGNAALWAMSEWNTAEYSQAVIIRGATRSHGEALSRRFLT